MRRIWRGVCKALEVIPRGTRVDPADFPEDEYPVRCLKCGYDLHGLADGRCPECGEAFERGMLLVETYARRRKPKRGRVRRATYWLGIVIVATWLLNRVPVTAFYMCAKWKTELFWILLDWMGYWLRFVAIPLVVIQILAWLSIMVMLFVTRVPLKKNKAMMRAALERVYGSDGSAGG